MSEFMIRDATPEDLEGLHQLILESTGGRTNITVASLHNDLFMLAGDGATEVGDIDPCIELDFSIIKSNTPMMRAFVAENNGIIVGYLLYHYYWAPWVGRMALIDDIYIDSSLNRDEIGSQFLRMVKEHGYRDDLKKMVFNVAEKKSSLLNIVLDTELSVVRDETTDWSVFRVPMQKT